QQLVRDLEVPVQVRVCPIVRESDGLALSSRNQYLDAEQRRNATVLHRALQAARTLVAQGERNSDGVKNALKAPIEAIPVPALDYAEVVDGDSLRPVDKLQGKILLAVAVRFGPTRLIDNELIDVP